MDTEREHNVPRVTQQEVAGLELEPRLSGNRTHTLDPLPQLPFNLFQIPPCVHGLIDSSQWPML
jgi:hypothetical protein